MKFKAFLLSLVMLLSCFSYGAIAEQETPKLATFLFNETFENNGNGYLSCVNADYSYTFPHTPSGNVIIVEADYRLDSNSINGAAILFGGTGDSDDKTTKRFSLFQMITGGKIRNTNYQVIGSHTDDEFNRIRIICDTVNNCYYLQVNGEAIDTSKYAYDSHDFNEIKYIYFDIGTTTIDVDNITVYSADSIDSFVSSPYQGETGVDLSQSIKVEFSRKMDIDTILEENFVLMNTTKNETVGFTIKKKKDCYVIIEPDEELLTVNSYKLSSTSSLMTADEESFEADFTEFSTKAIEIIDSCTLEDSAFSAGEASVRVINNSNESVTATAIAALYEKLSDGNESFIEYKTHSVTLGAEEYGNYSFIGFVTEEGKEYTVRFFLWNSVEGKTPYAKSVAVNGGSLEGEKVYIANGAMVTVKEADPDRAYVSFESDFDSEYPMRFTYVITNPNGAICFIGQAASDESGIAESKTRFKQGTPSGTYTINYKADGMAEDTCTFNLNMEQAKPTAVNVKIEGKKVEGEYLEGYYEYFHIGDIDEKDSAFSWYICDTANGEFSAIENATGKTLLVTQDFVLKYVRFGVTVKTATTSGTEVLSEPVKIYAFPIVSDVEISGDVKVGNTISASYKTYHPEGAEVSVNCRWLLAEGDIYTEISTQKNLDVSQSVGQKIVLEVTPVIDVYPYTGKSVLGAVKSVKAALSSVGAPSGGGGGGVERPPVQEEPPAPVVNDSFNDVSKDYWAYENIKTLSEKNIIKGKGEGNFAPEDTVTRAEFVTMIVRALNLEQSGEVEFSDVNAEDWYYSAINVAASLKIVSGHDGSFRPLSPITREEMAVIISNACNLLETEKSMENEVSFTDAAEISSWAKESIAKMVDAKILTGFEDGSFRGQSFSTRAQSATVICRLLGL